MELYNSKSRTLVSFGYEEATDSYTLKTNAIDSWWSKDDLSFAYERYSLPYGECSRIELNVILTSFQEFEARASAGLALRNSLTPSAANVFLIARRNTIFMTFRRHDGENTYAVRTDMPNGLSFPLALRLVRQGNIVSGSFKEPGCDSWRHVGSVDIPLESELYGGFGGYSYLADYPITAVFQHYRAEVTNTDFAPVDLSRTDNDEIPAGLLMRERFEDGSVTNLPASKTNPVWSNVTHANIIEITEKDGRKNRVWHKDFMPGYHFAGNVRWTDYALTADILFTKACRSASKNQVGFFVRQREMDLYGKFHYGVYLTDGNSIRICKSVAENGYNMVPLVSAPLDYLSNLGEWNRIRIEAFDNTVTVFWNDTRVLFYEDTGTVIAPFGRIGFMTEDTSVYLDNFIVTEMEDPLGGAYDNLIGGLFDEPAPADFVYDIDAEEDSLFISNSESTTGY
ncbi:MAG TPA: hypothetical protein IAC64_08465 [Candidatus Caccomorpha excrementavium]|nr:hypothetical protein [Candidatus Caccomorpha excrementavium]